MNEGTIPLSGQAIGSQEDDALRQDVREELSARTEEPLTPHSFFWRVIGFLLNLGMFLVLFQLYKLVRKTYISRGETVGYEHAEQIIGWQKSLHIFFEPDLQAWILDRPEWVIRYLNHYYVGFMPLFYASCAAALLFSPVRFRFWRRVFLCSMVLALPWYLIYPLAPPRFMPQYGFIDTLMVYGPKYFSSDGLVAANQYAAMPSMHIGWTTIAALMLWTCIPKVKGIPIGPILGTLHISIMTLTVMATGNHYFLDAVGGWIIIGGAILLALFLTDRFPFRLPRWFSPT
ncbi:MAG: phosphatase PAP2 family protein [Chloroflexota bacterium]|nr:phosphatase PAP2 family protein [Chloroflexota bacterium]